jgi:predicted Zn-dependent peptidase
VVRQAARPTEQTHLALGIRTWSRLDDRRYALRLLNAALGENMSSRLFQAVREEAGLVYSIDSTLSFFADTGDLVISAGLDGENLGRVLRLVVRELRRLACRPLTRTELARVRDYVLGQIDLSTENTESQMLALGEQVLAYGHTTTPETYQRRLRRVSAETIQRVAGECLRPERLTLALVSPVRQEREAAAALARL